MDYDLIVIGGGPAGYLAAERAQEEGLSTLLVEKKQVGGVCLNEGCIPTKTLLYSAKIYEYEKGKGAHAGVTCDHPAMEHKQVLRRKEEVIGTLVGGVKAALRKKKAQIVNGLASVGRKGNLFSATVNGETYTAKNLLLAMGSLPVIPPIPGVSAGIEKGDILTSREMLEIEEVPKELVIVGAGVIGLEMANYFSIAGSKVTMIEMLPGIGGTIDGDAEQVLKKQLEARGITFHLDSKVSDVSNRTVVFEKDGETKKISYDKLLLCVGRRPRIDLEGLDQLGVAMDRGAIVTNEACETNVAGIYAAGDVNGKYMLAHVAYREAEVAVNHIAGQKDTIDYSAVPGVIYTLPMEVAFAGMTEKEAKEAGIDVSVKKVPVNMSGRHIAENGITDGLCKLVVDREKQIIIGAAIVCSYASEMIYALTLMIRNKIPVSSIKKTIFPHPTVCEVIREALFV